MTDKRTIAEKKKQRKKNLTWGSIVSLWDIVGSVASMAKAPHCRSHEEHCIAQREALSTLRQVELPLSFLMELYTEMED